jgi:outer membrane murein-binding lipoprotein Lpp
MRKNQASIDVNMEISGDSLLQVDDELRDAGCALVAVNNSVDTMREQIAKIASDLHRANRRIERIRDASKEIDQLQSKVNQWISDTSALGKLDVASPVFKRRRDSFVDALWNLFEASILPGDEAVTTTKNESLCFGLLNLFAELKDGVADFLTKLETDGALQQNTLTQYGSVPNTAEI